MDKFQEKVGRCWEHPGKKKDKKLKHRLQRRRLKEELDRALRKDAA
jgi:hypothetical protein